MLELFQPDLDRFVSLNPEPALDQERLTGLIDRGSVTLDHLRMVREGTTDVGRVGLVTHADGAVTTFGWIVDHDHPEVESAYRLLFRGLAEAASADGIARILTTVVTRDEPSADAKRSALSANGWQGDGERLELEILVDSAEFSSEVEEISPRDPEVIRLMAAAMSESLDEYDQHQVEALGPEAAAIGYRDMMIMDEDFPWLVHRGPSGVDGVAAIEPFDNEWCLGYLGVDPASRGNGVGTALARAMVTATAKAGVPRATASVAVDNPPIRKVLERIGFTVWSSRFDYVLELRSRTEPL